MVHSAALLILPGSSGPSLPWTKDACVLTMILAPAAFNLPAIFFASEVNCQQLKISPDIFSEPVPFGAEQTFDVVSFKRQLERLNRLG